MEHGEYTAHVDARLRPMSSLRSRSSTGRSLLRRRLAWPILIIVIAIPVAFISGRLERERISVAVSFGEEVAMWDGRSVVPQWLADSAAHPLLLMDLSKRLARRPADATEVTIRAEADEDPAGGARWRVQLMWPDAPTVELLVAFEDLGTTPHLIGVGGGPAPSEVLTQ